MAVDTNLERELTNQIELLEMIRERLGEAIDRAYVKLKEVQDGKSREEVFPPEE